METDSNEWRSSLLEKGNPMGYGLHPLTRQKLRGEFKESKFL